jgi:Uma2 family endonuclease
MAVSEKAITAEEFFRMPEPADGTRYELAQGQLVTMSPPGPRHGEVCASILVRVQQFVKANQLGRVACNDRGIITGRDPDTVRGPDVASWSRERLPALPASYTDVVPDLAVEVLSPSESYSNVVEKALHYLDHGVRLVWGGDPDRRAATVFRSSGEPRVLRPSDEIRGEEVLPGFQCRRDKSFA